ncbi:FAD-dependent hydroxylase [Rubidibacter lacunae]|nr:FAD-dependent hydroxylase [Rubidibacter lacunae]
MLLTSSPDRASAAKTSTQYDCDVAIAGGGIVGVTLARALQASGLRVGIVEAQVPDAAIARDRSYAVSVLSSRILDGLGVWKTVFPRVGAFSRIHLSDADAPGAVEFELRDLGTDYLGFAGPHGALLSALQAAVADADSITWFCPATVADAAIDAQGATLTLNAPDENNRREVRARLLVAADGARSRVRASAGVRTRGWKYGQSCITTTFAHAAPANDTAFERFWPTGPMGVLPLPGNRCQVVWTNPHARAQELQATDANTFTTALERYTGGLLGRIELLSDRLVFPVQLLQSDRYVQPRLALVGDAAHCCHPVGGQGLNLGIRDAVAIAEVLTAAHHRGEDIGSLRVLQRYDRWRRWENVAILGLTDMLNRTFSNEWLPAVAVRRSGLWAMRRVPPVRRFSLSLMTGLLGRQPEVAHVTARA